MDYNIIENEGRVIIKNIKDFEPEHIFECGQCFRWNREEDFSYTGVAFGKILNVKKEGDYVIFSNTNLDEFKDIWFYYFDLERDYGEIKKILSKDPVLKEAISFGHGIRILQQDPFETLISFIISANNRIPRIKKSIEMLSKKYGEFIGEYKGKDYYSFPKARAIANLSEKEVQECKVGFRAKYILNASKIIDKNKINIYNLKNVSTEEARKNLLLFSGVGPKVSDCIMLFSLQKYDAFPVDVWVKRVMEYFYLKQDTKLKDIQNFAQAKFGEYAGFTQQYLFYYARELGIGKKG
jgi:N-glycosylase/DNA lyase